MIYSWNHRSWRIIPSLEQVSMMTDDLKLLTLEEFSERDIVVLRISGKMTMDHRRDFTSHCTRLMQSERTKKVIDLSRCESLFSIYFGTLVDLCQRASEDDRAITILTNPHLHELFEKANLASILPLVAVPVPSSVS